MVSVFEELTHQTDKDPVDAIRVQGASCRASLTLGFPSLSFTVFLIPGAVNEDSHQPVPVGNRREARPPCSVSVNVSPLSLSCAASSPVIRRKTYKGLKASSRPTKKLQWPVRRQTWKFGTGRSRNMICRRWGGKGPFPRQPRRCQRRGAAGPSRRASVRGTRTKGS